MENQEVVSFVGERLSDLKKASVDLAQRANEKWRQNEEVIDDITCVIVKFNLNASPEKS